MAHAIPKGHHAITPHLVIKGASEAIKFYKRAFGAELNSGQHAVPRARTARMKIGHAALEIGGSKFFLADEFPELRQRSAPATTPRCRFIFTSRTPNAAFDRAVEAGAKVTMPLADMFWGDRYGKVVDPFGHHWSIAEHLEDLTPEQMQERMALAFGGQPCA